MKFATWTRDHKNVIFIGEYSILGGKPILDGALVEMKIIFHLAEIVLYLR